MWRVREREQLVPLRLVPRADEERAPRAAAHVHARPDAVKRVGLAVFGARVAADPEEIVGEAAVRELAGNRQRAAEMGEAGRRVATAITWEGVVERLVAAGTAEAGARIP